MLYYMDTRFDVEIYRRQAHIGEVFGVSQSYQIKGLISSCGADSVSQFVSFNSINLNQILDRALNI